MLLEAVKSVPEELTTPALATKSPPTPCVCKQLPPSNTSPNSLLSEAPKLNVAGGGQVRGAGVAHSSAIDQTTAHQMRSYLLLHTSLAFFVS